MPHDLDTPLNSVRRIVISVLPRLSDAGLDELRRAVEGQIALRKISAECEVTRKEMLRSELRRDRRAA